MGKDNSTRDTLLCDHVGETTRQLVPAFTRGAPNN